jgi:hypothetical protein
MEQSYYDIQTVIRAARRQRSDALGELLAALWNKGRTSLGPLVQVPLLRRPAGR